MFSVSGVERLLKAHPDLATERDEYGFTALHYVMSEEGTDIPRLLIRCGADVNAATLDGITPMHNAQHPELVTLLLQNGAVLNARDKQGRTPLHLWATEGIHTGALEIIRALLAAGADANSVDNDGHSPLDLAKSRASAGADDFENEKVKLLSLAASSKPRNR